MEGKGCCTVLKLQDERQDCTHQAPSKERELGGAGNVVHPSPATGRLVILELLSLSPAQTSRPKFPIESGPKRT